MTLNEIFSELKFKMNQKYKLLSLCMLSCILTFVYFHLFYDQRPHAVESKRAHGTFCYEEILDILKAIKFDETQDVDISRKALDLVTSAVKAWLGTNKYNSKTLSNFQFWELDSIQSKLHVENFYKTIRNKFGTTTAIMKTMKKNEDKENKQLPTEDVQNSITILLNFNNFMRYKDMKNIEQILEDITKLFPGVSTIVKSPHNIQWASASVTHLKLTSMDKDSAKIWNDLVAKVKTKYILIMKDIMNIEQDLDLQNLLKKLIMLKADVVGGAHKNVHDGHWDMGCYQMAFRNYALVYKSGYKHSKYSCVYCDSISGPFLTTTDTLRKFRFAERLTDELMFQDLFLRLFKEKSIITVCPDNMFTTRKMSLFLKRKQWLPFARKNDVHRIVAPDKSTFEYSCEELGIINTSVIPTKTAPLCAMHELANHIKFIMKLCIQHLIVCELSWGTQLGAVKFNGLAPWDVDGDVSFFTPQAHEIWDLKPIFEKNGYTLHNHKYTGEWDSPWFKSEGKFWRIDLFNRSAMDSVDQILEGKSPTKVLFYGDWVETSNNVGQYVQSYGPEIYQHKDYGLSFEPYSDKHYAKCTQKGDHNCIDLFPSDGNIDMGDPSP